MTCKTCGAEFSCNPEGVCWCMAQPAKLSVPSPDEGATCLCPSCLEKLSKCESPS
jgi:hypothetical protein